MSRRFGVRGEGPDTGVGGSFGGDHGSVLEKDVENGSGKVCRSSSSGLGAPQSPTPLHIVSTE